MVLRRVALAASLLALGALSLAACGPSFQVVYEGDARFEHCYALDETPSVPMPEKTECWTQWMKAYTYGQTRNRVDYAALRAKVLQEAPVMPTDEAVMSAAPGGATAGRGVGVNNPASVNPFATPPKTMSEAEAGHESWAPAGASTDGAPIPAHRITPVAPQEPPAESCADRCRTAWHSCKGACEGKACADCDRPYKACMKKCF